MFLSFTLRHVILAMLLGSATVLVLWYQRLNRRILITFLAVYDEPCPYGHAHPPSIFRDTQCRQRRAWIAYALVWAGCLLSFMV